MSKKLKVIKCYISGDKVTTTPIYENINSLFYLRVVEISCVKERITTAQETLESFTSCFFQWRLIQGRLSARKQPVPLS